MRWRVFPREDGGFTALVAPPGYEGQEGEELLDYIPEPETHVWDPSGQVREKNDSEKLADAKERKIHEVTREVVDALDPITRADPGDRELLFVIAAHVKGICEALGQPVDPRLDALVEVGQQAEGKLPQIDGAQSPADLEDIHLEG